MSTKSGVIVVTMKDHEDKPLDYMTVVSLEADDTLTQEQEEALAVIHCQEAGMSLLTQFANSFKRDEDRHYQMRTVEFENFTNSTTQCLTHFMKSTDTALEFDRRATCARGLSHIVKVCYKYVEIFNQ